MADEQFAEQFLKDWGYFYKHERDYKKAEKALLKLLEQVRGQAQAEVLASAITLFAQREPHHRAWAEPVRLLRNLQPAAKDLEALLRKERVKELRHFAENAPGYDTAVMRFIDARIAELEKARALLKESHENQ